MNIFLLPTQDGEHVSGAKIPAIQIIENRVKQRKWPLYERTRNRKAMTQGDILLFYVAGNKLNSGHIIGQAKIENISQNLRNAVFIDGEDILNGSASSIIEMSEFKSFRKLVHLKSILKNLDCCPKSMSKWGVILYGGARKITERDYTTICVESR